MFGSDRKGSARMKPEGGTADSPALSEAKRSERKRPDLEKKMRKTFTDINKIPFLTWNWLKMNRASVEADVPEKAEAGGISVLNKNDNVEVLTDAGGTKITAKGKALEPVFVHFDFEGGKYYSHTQTITAEANAEVTVVFDYASGSDAAGLSEIKTAVHAKPFSKVRIVKTQLLGGKYVQIDGTCSFLDEGAACDVVQVELGGGKVYAEVRSDLSGARSKFTSETAFAAKDEQVLDMNYVVNLLAPGSETKMSVKGSVSGHAQKTYKGTMNFKRGCGGAKGDEQEETLLMSNDAVNKSLPMILCDEEDVEGSHGATLGRLGADELFYMESRGIGEAEAKSMMMKAKVMSTAALIPDEGLKKKIEDFIEAGN